MLLSQLKKGETATIENFNDVQLALKFIEMGISPGAKITLYAAAPLGDPIAIEVEGTKISMRKKEAATITIIPSFE